MTNTKILSVFAIVAVAAMMGAASIAPAYAATKDVDERDEFHDTQQALATVCGVTSNLTQTVDIVTFVKIWSNGHFKIHTELFVVITDDDNNDAVVLSQKFVGNTQGNFNAGTTQSIQVNQSGFCADGTNTFSINAGNTLHRDGSITDHHISFF